MADVPPPRHPAAEGGGAAGAGGQAQAGGKRRGHHLVATHRRRVLGLGGRVGVRRGGLDGVRRRRRKRRRRRGIGMEQGNRVVRSGTNPRERLLPFRPRNPSFFWSFHISLSLLSLALLPPRSSAGCSCSGEDLFVILGSCQWFLKLLFLHYHIDLVNFWLVFLSLLSPLRNPTCVQFCST